MQKVLLIPDSFKGTMSSADICERMQRAVHRFYPQAQTVCIPVADGGEGSVDCFLAAIGGEKVSLRVKGPYMQEMEGFYGRLPDGTAVVEMAACAGLPLVGDEKNPLQTTTFGVGELILHAACSGARRIIVGLGGSATNDGGAGAAAAAGVRFYDREGNSFIPVGGTLEKIARIDMRERDAALNGVEIVAMCDIDNPLCGENGAAAVFGPQKGATPEMVKQLDDGLFSMAQVLLRDTGEDLLKRPGAGAAGGMGAGMVAFFGARLQMGIETVLDTVSFDKLLQGADLVLTGEGKIDGQSLRGKVVIGVARRAKRQGVPVIAVVGDIGDDIEGVYEQGVTGVFSINRVAVDFKQAKVRSRSDLEKTVENLMRYMQAMGL
ncbi:MAG: glycerate kinase [Provencibacterium sp.]|nr:glycerate kinase [Provencibacterium sp.]